MPLTVQKVAVAVARDTAPNSRLGTQRTVSSETGRKLREVRRNATAPDAQPGRIRCAPDLNTERLKTEFAPDAQLGRVRCHTGRVRCATDANSESYS